MRDLRQDSNSTSERLIRQNGFHQCDVIGTSYIVRNRQLNFAGPTCLQDTHASTGSKMLCKLGHRTRFDSTTDI